MLVFVDANLVLFAVPKTGSTAYHLALRGKADISLANKAWLKHMTVRKFARDFGPFLASTYDLHPERVAVIRDPLEHLRSWYRYRQVPKSAGKGNSAAGLSFDDFVLETLKDTPEPFARIGTQHTFVSGEDDQPQVHHLFAYEKPLLFRRFLEDRLKTKIDVKERNVSPPAPTPISAAVESELRRVRAADFALHDRIMQAGGHLASEVAG